MRTLKCTLLVFCITALLSCNLVQEEALEKMTYVEGGVFVMGTDNAVIDSLSQHYGFPRDYIQSEYPPHKVTISSFYIDRYEATNEDFKRFIDNNPQWSKNNISDSLHNGDYLTHWDGDYYPSGEKKLPIYNLSWYAAVAFCQWQGKRLPTEAEWEFVASNRGLDWVYPWGNSDPDSLKVNYNNIHGRAIEVGKYPPNQLGVFDLAGNLWEYTLDQWDFDFYKKSPARNPVNGPTQYDNRSLSKVKNRRIIADIDSELVQFFNTHLKEHAPKNIPPPVKLYVIHQGRQSEKHWPLYRQQRTGFYLNPSHQLLQQTSLTGIDTYQVDLAHSSNYGSTRTNRWVSIFG